MKKAKTPSAACKLQPRHTVAGFPESVPLRVESLEEGFFKQVILQPNPEVGHRIEALVIPQFFSVHDQALGYFHRNNERERRFKRRTRVTSILGLLNTRSSLGDINAYPKLEVKRACCLCEFSYLSSESLSSDVQFREMMVGFARGFPFILSGSSNPRDAHARAWCFEDSDVLFISFKTNECRESVQKYLGLSADSLSGVARQGSGMDYVSDLLTLAPSLRTLLYDKSKSYTQIVTTGHGLGGGLATVASPFISDMLPDIPIVCITFGAPKVGSAVFEDWYTRKVSRSIRVVHSGDPIPFLPCYRSHLHCSPALCISRSGYTEEWSSHTEPTPQVTYGIEKIDFDSWDWKHSAVSYRRRINAALKLEKAGKSTKRQAGVARRIEARGA